eukprot:3576464-Amphidinium_carterae.2
MLPWVVVIWKWCALLRLISTRQSLGRVGQRAGAAARCGYLGRHICNCLFSTNCGSASLARAASALQGL